MNTPFIPDRIYKFLFVLFGLVYIIGLFVPLMDNDSAHHADIALRMYMTGDYVNLIDQGGDYLDKPHFLFWAATFSYKIFGVTSFAYRFPSFLFTILGVYSTYRLGKKLYDKETGKLAALILVSSFAFILANTDVRMDAILTACIVFSIWQLVEFIDHRKMLNVAGAALGLALGFSTKGHIAVFVPAVAALFYIAYKKNLQIFFSWKWLVFLVLFALFISPVVYCYYQQFNLHPEKIVRGHDHINGVKFILFQQSIERFGGESFGNDSKHDYFFFLHSFLWAFAPWSILAYIAVVGRIKTLLSRKEEWLTIGVFIIMLVVVSFSGFKLPHYLNIIFPTTAILAAGFILNKKNNSIWIKNIFITQLCIVFLLLLLVAIINTWSFPVKNPWIILAVVLLLAFVFYFIKSKAYNTLQKTVCVSASSMAFVFFLLNSNFYPQLLRYQGGNVLAFKTKGTVDPREVYFWDKNYSPSYNFYSASLRKPFVDSILQQKKAVWLLFDINDEEAINKAGYKFIGNRFSTLDYGITMLNIKFINPAKRNSVCTKMVLAQITK